MKLMKLGVNRSRINPTASRNWTSTLLTNAASALTTIRPLPYLAVQYMCTQEATKVVTI